MLLGRLLSSELFGFKVHVLIHEHEEISERVHFPCNVPPGATHIHRGSFPTRYVLEKTVRLSLKTPRCSVLNKGPNSVRIVGVGEYQKNTGRGFQFLEIVNAIVVLALQKLVELRHDIDSDTGPSIVFLYKQVTNRGICYTTDSN